MLQISHRKLLYLALIIFPLVVNAGALEQLFAPEAKLQQEWLAHNNQSTQKIDHTKWNHFLKNNINQGSDGINRIAYALVSELDKNKLRSYIDSMQAISISEFNRDEQLAYWINLYNAVTVNVVLKNYPVATIRDIDISPGFFSDGPWGKKLIKVENREISLNDIEHGILRPIWKDARIHYAVNCASISCPDLSVRAYSAATMDHALNVAAKKYIAHPRAVRFTEEGLIVSSIYSWFQKDFGEQESDVIKHIQHYASSELARKLEGVKFFDGDEYDWSLNDISDNAQ